MTITHYAYPSPYMLMLAKKGGDKHLEQEELDVRELRLTGGITNIIRRLSSYLLTIVQDIMQSDSFMRYIYWVLLAMRMTVLKKKNIVNTFYLY